MRSRTSTVFFYVSLVAIVATSSDIDDDALYMKDSIQKSVVSKFKVCYF